MSRDDLTPACAKCFKISEPQPTGTLRACNWLDQGLHYHSFYRMFGVNKENHERSPSEQPMTRLRFKTVISQIPIRNVNTTQFGTHKEKEERAHNTKQEDFIFNSLFFCNVYVSAQWHCQCNRTKTSWLIKNQLLLLKKWEKRN